MAMAVDSRQQLGGMPYEHMRYSAPHFTNPWVSAPSAGTQLYAQSPVSADQGRSSMSAAASMPYSSQGLPAMSMPAEYPRPYGTAYPASSATSASGFTAPTSAPNYDYSQSRVGQYSSLQDRRTSHPMSNISEAERSSFSDALDASRGMVAMSQDITPRNIYGNQGSSRSSTDSYGFPSGHSTHSSISSASTYPSYYGSSVSESSYGDYSSASESIDVPSRTLPRPSGLVGGQLPPAPQSMMGQFSSKVSSSSQKKHKCKICDKRFTRPSSLQTHMYSHTGEKPFACDVEGCGRHFSVVSNLRRHRKVHKGESDHPSPDDD